MRTEVVFQNEERAVRAARTLAEFANLTQGDVVLFSGKHKTFAPSGWWQNQHYSTSKNRLEYTWEQMQDHVREIWKKKFPHNLCIGMVQMGATFSNMQEQWDYQQSLNLDEQTTPPEGVGWGFSKWPTVWDYQLALMFLNVQSWRAKICKICKNFYIAESPNGQFCNFNARACFWKHRKKDQKDSREKNRQTTNERRRAEYATRKKKINAHRRAQYAALKAKKRRI